MPIKRLNYFNHQFLVEADFTAQQNYHLNMRRHLNRVLHTFGIAEGLEVSKTANKVVTVKPGTAIDRDGREMLQEAAKVIDLSDTTQFPAGSTIFVIATYRETLSDQTTAATAADGHPRITEEPVSTAVRTPPATDGSVVRLATFTLDAAGNVPGNINDSLDGGVRQRVGVRGIEQGLVSIEGVSNPGGNIDLFPTDSIIVAPDDAGNRVRIGETHSGRSDNPHGTTAAQIGAMLAADFDLRRRSLATIVFTGENKDGAALSIPLAFQFKVAIVVGTCTASLTGRAYSGGIGGFAFFDTSGQLIQRSFGFGITKISNTDWLFRSLAGLDLFTANIQDQGSTPPQGETFHVGITSSSATGLVATFNRTVAAPTFSAIEKFNISLQLLCMG